MPKQRTFRHVAGIAIGSALIVGSAMLAPSAALAGRAQGGGNVVFSAAAKENNQLKIDSGAGTTAGESAVTVTEVASGVELKLSPGKCHKLADVPAANPADAPHPSVSCTSKRARVVANVRDGDDVVLGSGPAAYALNGGLGADRLRGSSAGDKINGGKGDDVLIGGEGGDVIGGSAGNDQIDSADNGTSDRVKCGAGNDLVATDLDANGKPIGDIIAKDCEQVVQKQEDFSCTTPVCQFVDDPGSSFTDPVDDDTGADCAAVSAIGKSTKISKSSAKVKLVAPAATTSTCVGKIRMDARLRSKKGKKVKKVKLGSASFAIAPGRSDSVKIKLTKRGAKLVKKFKRVRALVTVSTNQDLSGGAVISSRSITLKGKKSKKAAKHGRKH